MAWTPGDMARASLRALRSLLFPVAVLLAAAAGPTASLDIQVSNVRNDKGHVLAAVCTQSQFLTAHCAYVGSVPSRSGEVTVRISGIPPGTYAVQVFQDENDNKAIDRNFIGIPTEGMGFSNDARFHFGPPSFADAAVRIGAAGG
ncbi:MAG TPA: DUF2141 domain-containing protein, partial [Rhodopila sp.]|nr:DUF2141 domain-containing protein [Rhodopila sp.]